MTDLRLRKTSKYMLHTIFKIFNKLIQVRFLILKLKVQAHLHISSAEYDPFLAPSAVIRDLKTLLDLPLNVVLIFMLYIFVLCNKCILSFGRFFFHMYICMYVHDFLHTYECT